MTKAKTLRDQSIEELEAALVDARTALFKVKSGFSQGNKMEGSHLKFLHRKEIARLLTILHEKKATSENGAI